MLWCGFVFRICVGGFRICHVASLIYVKIECDALIFILKNGMPLVGCASGIKYKVSSIKYPVRCVVHAARLHACTPARGLHACAPARLCGCAAVRLCG